MRNTPPLSPDQRGRIILLSPSGWGNEGDNAILRGLTAALSTSFERHRIVLATLSPQDSADAIGVAAVPIIGCSKRGYYIKSHSVARPRSQARRHPEAAPTSEHSSESPASLRTLVKRVLPTPLHRIISPLVNIPVKVRAEVKHAFRIWRWLGPADAVIVSGGGQLDELWGGAWGHPFAIATWAFLCRLRGVRFFVLGVGVGETAHPVTKVFFRFVLTSARHVSVRDSRSAAVAAGLKGSEVNMSRDLAFLLVDRFVAKKRSVPPDSGMTIAVSPMAFGRKGIWPRAEMEVFRNLTTAFVGACEAWVDSGHRLEFFISDKMDRETTREIVEALRSRRPQLGSQIAFRTLSSLDELMDLLAETDVSVVARLHGVVLSQILGLPTVAVSHNWKVTEQMRMAGNAEFAFDPATVTAADLADAVRKAVLEHGEISERTSTFAALCREMIERDIEAVRSD